MRLVCQSAVDGLDDRHLLRERRKARLVVGAQAISTPSAPEHGEGVFLRHHCTVVVGRFGQAGSDLLEQDRSPHEDRSPVENTWICRDPVNFEMPHFAADRTLRTPPARTIRPPAPT